MRASRRYRPAITRPSIGSTGFDGWATRCVPCIRLQLHSLIAQTAINARMVTVARARGERRLERARASAVVAVSGLSITFHDLCLRGPAGAFAASADRSVRAATLR